jgi:hypothetical protein
MPPPKICYIYPNLSPMFHHSFFGFFTGTFGLILAIFCLFPYFLPTILAVIRKHPSTGGIFALNFFLGWTVIGWIASLVWALSDNRTEVFVNNPSMSYDPPPSYNPSPSNNPSPSYNSASTYSQSSSKPETSRPTRQTDPTVRPASKYSQTIGSPLGGAQTSSSQAKIDQLRQLKQLLDEGVLTEEEFNKQKAAILG